MESSLHRQLKEKFGVTAGGQNEVRIGRYRVDAIDAGGRIVEVQAGKLGALRDKLGCLLQTREVLVVKPVPVIRRIVRRARPNGPDLSIRRSPKRGELLDVFEELVGLARAFPHPNLTIEVVGVAIDEVRVPRRSREQVVDRRLAAMGESITLREAADLWHLLPAGLGLDGPLTTLDLAYRLNRPVEFAQRVAYCLRHAGAVQPRGIDRRRRVYAREVAAVMA